MPATEQAGDLRRPPPPFVGGRKPTQLLSFKAQVTGLARDGPAPRLPQARLPLAFPFLFLFPFFFFQFFVFYFKETHTHTLSRKQDLSYQLAQSPNHTPSAHFPAQRTSPSQGPRRCGLTRGCPIKRIYFLELKNICGKVDYHLAAHQQLLKTGL